jgi:orotate phosphoribosyltransferase
MKPADLAQQLISLGCVALSPLKPFTYASGLKGPIYCDNRQLLSFPKERGLVADSFVQRVTEEHLKFDAIAGIATAGIPHAAFIAERLQVPLLYVRGKPKDHGKQNQVEGAFKKGQRILLVEDLVNQGGSVEEAAIGARAAGLIAEDCLAIVDYEMAVARARFQQLGIRLTALTTFSALAECALKQGLVDQSGYHLLNEWREDPVAWSARHS